MTMDNKTSGDGWNDDEEWASFEDNQQDNVPHSTTATGLKLKPTSDPFAELQVNSTAKRKDRKKEKEPSWEDFLGSTGSSANQPRYEHKQPTPPPVNASLFDNPSMTGNSWTNSGWEDDDATFGDWGQDVSQEYIVQLIYTCHSALAQFSHCIALTFQSLFNASSIYFNLHHH